MLEANWYMVYIPHQCNAKTVLVTVWFVSLPGIRELEWSSCKAEVWEEQSDCFQDSSHTGSQDYTWCLETISQLPWLTQELSLAILRGRMRGICMIF
jgi:hypothetical protein